MMVATATVPPRRFVPAQIDLSEWSHIEPLTRQLLDRPIKSADDLEQWLLDLSELSSAIDEYGSRRYIDKSCHTDDPEIAARYMHYVENIEPKFKVVSFQAQKKLLDSTFHPQLQGKKYEVLIRQWRADVEIFREENVPLETQVTKLVTEYDEICGAMMVHFRGKEYTLQQLARFTEEPDRQTRQAAWEAGTERRLQDREKIESIFEQILPLREQIARNTGLSDFRAYMWKALKRFDYTPDDCLRFADAVEQACMPLVHELNRQRAADLGLEKLRPWDLAVDPKNRPPLRPFDESDIEGFVSRTGQIMQRLSPQLFNDFDSLRQRNNLDLGSRKGKQPGGYQATLNEVREPFIFMNAAGMHGDVNTLLHEAGHAFHALAAREEPLLFLRHAPMEFCEVASMAMELLGAEHLDVFYDEAESARARRTHLEGIIRFFPWMAVIDSFQHWIYTHPGHSRAQRTKKWIELHRRFSGEIDWSGYEAAREALWQRQLHLFHVPFYYVEYGIAQLGALQLWMKAKQDPQRALSAYRAGLKLGGTRPLPELFAATGIRFDFSEQTLRPLMQAVAEELNSLPQ